MFKINILCISFQFGDTSSSEEDPGEGTSSATATPAPAAKRVRQSSSGTTKPKKTPQKASETDLEILEKVTEVCIINRTIN